MTKYVLLLNGDLTVTNCLKNHLDGASIIAVDGGIRHAETLGIAPEFWLGDFDSSDETANGRWSEISRLKFPREKNDSDGALAIDYAIEHGASEIVLLAAGGGRCDMVLVHHLQLIDLAKRGIKCSAMCGAQEVLPIYACGGIEQTLTFEAGSGCGFSIIGFSDFVGLTVKGAKWPLEQENVKLGSTLTLSNEVTGVNEAAGCVQVELSSGYGVVVVDRTE